MPVSSGRENTDRVMKIEIEIKTDAYDEPCRTTAIYENDDSFVKLKWSQQHEGEKKPSVYKMEYDRASEKATIRRSGEVGTVLEFVAGEVTCGAVTTAYGTIPVDIRTEYINLPSLVSPLFEICYEMTSAGSDLIKNIFSIKLLLQK